MNIPAIALMGCLIAILIIAVATMVGNHRICKRFEEEEQDIDH
jgi:hypothetical protein